MSNQGEGRGLPRTGFGLPYWEGQRTALIERVGPAAVAQWDADGRPYRTPDRERGYVATVLLDLASGGSDLSGIAARALGRMSDFQWTRLARAAWRVGLAELDESEQ